MLLALTDQFSDSYIPLYEQGLLPKPLSLLYEEVLLTFSQLLNKSESVYHNTRLTANQKKVEEMTREQANSKLWFQQWHNFTPKLVYMVVNMRIRHVKLTW